MLILGFSFCSYLATAKEWKKESHVGILMAVIVNHM